MRRLAVIMMLLLAGCAAGKRIEFLHLSDLHTEHLNYLSAEAVVRNDLGREVRLTGADAVITYRGRKMCRIVLSRPLVLAAESISQVCLEADMEIYDMAVLSAFTRLYGRDSEKAMSFVSLDGRATVKIGAAERKIKLR